MHSGMAFLSFVPSARRSARRRRASLPAVIRCLHVGAALHQHARHVPGAAVGRPVERRPAVPVARLDSGPAVEQHDQHPAGVPERSRMDGLRAVGRPRVAARAAVEQRRRHRHRIAQPSGAASGRRSSARRRRRWPPRALTPPRPRSARRRRAAGTRRRRIAPRRRRPARAAVLNGARPGEVGDADRTHLVAVDPPAGLDPPRSGRPSTTLSTTLADALGLEGVTTHSGRRGLAFERLRRGRRRCRSRPPAAGGVPAWCAATPRGRS